MEVGHVQELHHSPVAAAVGKLLQAVTGARDDVRVAVVMLARQEQQPLPVRRPLRHEVEWLARLDLPGLRAVGVGHVYPVALVVGDALAIR